MQSNSCQNCAHLHHELCKTQSESDCSGYQVKIAAPPMTQLLPAGVGTPLMAAGGGAGAVTVWDLEKRRLQTIIRDAHDAPLLSLHFFPGEPRLMSSAGDNSLKQVDAVPHWRRLDF
jgi:WD40 repeat protein